MPPTSSAVVMSTSVKRAEAADLQQLLPGDGATMSAVTETSKGSNRSSCYTTSSATMTAEEDSGDMAPEEDEDENVAAVRPGAHREGGIWQGNINILKILFTEMPLPINRSCTRFFADQPFMPCLIYPLARTLALFLLMLTSHLVIWYWQVADPHMALKMGIYVRAQPC